MAESVNTSVGQQVNAASPSKGRRQLKRKEAMLRRAKALNLRIAGGTYQQIADALGYKNRDGAFRAIDTALRDIPRESAERLKVLELDRLDKMQAILAKQVNEGHLGAVDRWLKIMEHRAKLLGIYAPEKQQVAVSGGMTVIHSPVPQDEVTGGSLVKNRMASVEPSKN
jgi:hypothetical protein